MTPIAGLPSAQDVCERLRRRLRMSGLKLRDIAAAGLEFLHEEAGAWEGEIYQVKSDFKTLQGLMQIDHDGKARPFNEEYPILDDSLLERVIEGKVAIHCTDDPTHSYHRRCWIRLGSAQVPWERSQASQPYGLIYLRVDKIQDPEALIVYAQELGEWMAMGQINEQSRLQTEQIRTFSELSLLFVTSLRLEDRLRLILEGLQSLFGFDRIKLYLADL
ncbi:MAG: hypothetical protein AABZ44_01345, partial [Elusimicrobiota bacterium]